MDISPSCGADIHHCLQAFFAKIMALDLGNGVTVINQEMRCNKLTNPTESNPAGTLASIQIKLNNLQLQRPCQEEAGC
jgi:hypothetical protein